MVGFIATFTLFTPFFVIAVLSTMSSAITLVWLIGTVIFWRSFQQEAGKQTLRQKFQDLGMASIWFVSVGLLVGKLIYDVGTEEI
jgi:uncharacterized membrane protein YecN with MAPEG domain